MEFPSASLCVVPSSRTTVSLLPLLRTVFSCNFFLFSFLQKIVKSTDYYALLARATSHSFFVCFFFVVHNVVIK